MKNMQLTFAIIIIFILCAASALIGYEKNRNGQSGSAALPQARADGWWIQRHQAIVEQIKYQKPDIIFIGDSITHGWEGPGKDVWQKYYAQRNAMNMGFSGDRTQHVLWRLENGEINGISPKLAILLIGTNNSNGSDNTATEIGQGIIAICHKLQKDLPNTKILILGILPRGPKPSAQRQKNAEASKLAAAIADEKTIYYLDIGGKFIDKDGTLLNDLIPDYLHPGEKGYEVWAQAIEPTVQKLLKN